MGTERANPHRLTSAAIKCHSYFKQCYSGAARAIIELCRSIWRQRHIRNLLVHKFLGHFGCALSWFQQRYPTSSVCNAICTHNGSLYNYFMGVVIILLGICFVCLKIL